jgi:cation:H+ antiporter
VALEVAIAIAALIGGTALLIYSSDKAVMHSISIASAMGISPLMIGLVLVSIGTDLPEVANSIVSSSLGHGNINVGDSLGSVLAQMSLVLGLLPFFVETFNVKREEIIVIGACEILALMLVVSMAEKGNLSSLNGFFLVVSWPIFLLFSRKVTTKKEALPAQEDDKGKLHHFIIVILGFAGVAVGAYVVVEAVIAVSSWFNINEYLISFFVLAIGTSLPEFVVDLTALRKGQHELAIGDIIGSSLFDACFSIGIGALFFPIEVATWLVELTGLYVIFVSVVVILTLALREKVDKKAGAFFLLLYALSYLLPYI